MKEIINHTHHLHPRPSARKQSRLVGLRLISFAGFVVYDDVTLLPTFNARRLAFPFHNAVGDAWQTRFLSNQSKRTFVRRRRKINVSLKTTFPRKNFLKKKLDKLIIIYSNILKETIMDNSGQP